MEKINKTSTLSKTISKKREATSNDAEMEIRKREMFNNINSFIKDIETMKVYRQENVNRSENKLTEINKQATAKENIMMTKTNEENATVEENTDSSAWKKLDEITHYVHDPLTGSKDNEAKWARIFRQEGFDIPAFILGLKSEYPKEQIKNFMFDIFGIDCVVDSIKKRSSDENNEKIYDVHLWVSEDNFMRILSLDEFFSGIVTKELALHEFKYGIKDYLFALPIEFFEKCKNLINYTILCGSKHNPMDILINRYLYDTKALFKVLAQ